jgi:sugar lactone lactonase YvrE
MNTGRLVSIAALLAVIAAAGLMYGPTLQGQTGAPLYEADPAWPQPLPDQWVLGGLGGLCVDADDHVLILNRQDVLDVDLNAGRLAPPMIEFDPDGKVVNAWGDPALLDPRLHTCHFDQDGNVWIGSAPSGMVQQYTHDGRVLLKEIGTKGTLDSSDGTIHGEPLNSNAARFFAPASIVVDRLSGEVFVADGEGRGGNRRIVVLSQDGAFLRQILLDDMDSVHCMGIASDGTVYVCDRRGSRVRRYDRMGIFLGDIAVPWTPVTRQPEGQPRVSDGSAVALDFSSDSSQRLLFIINQDSARVEIIERATGTLLGNFGRAGSFPGQFDQPHGIAVDSQGNVYIAENRGRRVHKFRIASQP